MPRHISDPCFDPLVWYLADAAMHGFDFGGGKGYGYGRGYGKGNGDGRRNGYTYGGEGHGYHYLGDYIQDACILLNNRRPPTF